MAAAGQSLLEVKEAKLFINWDVKMGYFRVIVQSYELILFTGLQRAVEPPPFVLLLIFYPYLYLLYSIFVFPHVSLIPVNGCCILLVLVLIFPTSFFWCHVAVNLGITVF